jgi:hypothetical protein
MASFYGNRQSKADPQPGSLDFEEVKLGTLPPYSPPDYKEKDYAPHPEVILQVAAPKTRAHRQWKILLAILAVAAVLIVIICASVVNEAIGEKKSDVNHGPTIVDTTTVTGMSVSVITVTPTLATPIIIQPGHSAGPLPSLETGLPLSEIGPNIITGSIMTSTKTGSLSTVAFVTPVGTVASIQGPSNTVTLKIPAGTPINHHYH